MAASRRRPGEPIAWIADPSVDIATPGADTSAVSTVDWSNHDVREAGLFSVEVSAVDVSALDIDNEDSEHKDTDNQDMGHKVVGSGSVLAHGRWGHPDQLALPLSDRGLQLADGLFETLLMEQGQPRLLSQHLERWRSSAALLGMTPPPGAEALKPRIAEAVLRSGIDRGALRLNWSRGSGGRGLDLPTPGEPQASHRFWLQLVAWQPRFGPITAIISRQERRNADSQLSRCKSFAYGSSIQARREARAAGADDALLLNGRDELCCGSAANLLVRRRGRWLTPADDSGCLPGIMRQRALDSGLAETASLSREDLFRSDGALLINSLGCRPLSHCEGQALPSPEPTEAETLWRSLLDQE